MTGYIFGKMILHSHAKKFVESYPKNGYTIEHRCNNAASQLIFM